MAVRALTRREVVRAAGVAVLAAGAGPALPRTALAAPLDAGRRAPRRLAAAIDLTPNGIIAPGSPQDYLVVRAQPWWPAMRAVTTHLRVWADWPTLQPDPALPLGDARSPGYGSLVALDQQVGIAEQDGLRVILMPYRYPPWANGTAGLATASPADLAHMPADRASAAAWAAAPPGGTPAGFKAREYGLPLDGHGPGSAWATYVAALLDRYGPAVDTLEVVNEPNLQLWPQRSPAAADTGASELTIHTAVAEMMVTADGLTGNRGVNNLGPSAADAAAEEPRLVSAIQDGFADALLDELDRRGFRGGCHWTWSYHNYGDVEQGTANAVDLRERLGGRWRGLQLDGGAALAATEGACRLSALPGDLHEQRLAAQAERLVRAVSRHRDPADLGAGLTLLTHYTATADPNYDCGLREADGRDRPAFAAWCAALA